MDVSWSGLGTLLRNTSRTIWNFLDLGYETGEKIFTVRGDGRTTLTKGGLKIIMGGQTISAGGLYIADGGQTIEYDGLYILEGGVNVTDGGGYIQYSGTSKRAFTVRRRRALCRPSCCWRVADLYRSAPPRP